MGHENRKKENRTEKQNPTPAEIVSARVAAGLSVREAAELIHGSLQAWEAWEAGERRMHPGLFELFNRKLKEKATQ